MSIFSNRSSSSTRKSDDTMNDDTDDKDDTKRKSRNLSEKKRRDQFNLLINELSSMVSANGRKMDKSTVLKSTISFLKNHNDITERSRSSEIQEDWKPAFLSNEEFTHLFLEAIDGFIISFSAAGCVLYVSESITSLLGHLPSKVLGAPMYDLIHESDHSTLYNILLGSSPDIQYNADKEAEISFVCHFKRGSMQPPQAQEEPVYEIVQFIGFLKYDAEVSQMDKNVVNRYTDYPEEGDTRVIFVGTGRLQTPQLIREVLIMDSTKSEFTSRHSLEWKFLFLDHRAPPIIGYLPFEVLGTSGYDYYHVDDLDKVVTCHEALMEKGEGTSCYYRFLTKGQQWIWLQTRFYITYHQWNSKPEFIVCTHRVVSYLNLLKQNGCEVPELEQRRSSSHSSSSKLWSSKSQVSKTQKNMRSDFSSISADSSLPRHSHMSSKSMRLESSTSGANVAASSSKGDWNARETLQSVSPILEISSSYNQAQQLPSYSSQHLGPQTHQVIEVNQLERKHEELQQMIVEQQAELRRLSEQLLMARYGLLPSIINVPMPYAMSQPGPVQPSTPNSDIYLNPNTLPGSPILLDPHQVANGGDNYHMAHGSQQPDMYSNNSIAPSSNQHKH